MASSIGQIISKALGGIERRMARSGGRNLTRLSLLAKLVTGSRRPTGVGAGSVKTNEPPKIASVLRAIGGTTQADRGNVSVFARLASALRSQKMTVEHREAKAATGAGSVPEAPQRSVLGSIGSVLSGALGGIQKRQDATGRGKAADRDKDKKKRTTDGPAQVVRDGFNSLSGMAPGNVGKAAAAVVGTFIGLVAAGEKLANALIESQREMADFNSAVAVAYQKMRAGEIKRSFESAANRAKSIEHLAEAAERFDDAAQEFKDLFAILGNNIGAAVKNGLASILEFLKYVPFIAGAIERMEKEAKAKGNWGVQVVRAMATGQRGKKQDLPK